MKTYYGILKFFSKKEYLEDFLNGKMYCNTPHNYRSTPNSGVGDIREACIISSYNNPEVIITINKIPINAKDMKLVIHREESIQSYLHCWYALSLPSHNGEPTSVTCVQENLQHIKDEFGHNYVFIQLHDIPIFLKKLHISSGMDVRPGFINYTDFPENNLFQKHSSYSYQNEFRIAIGTCGVFDSQALEFTVKSGFRDIAITNPEFILNNIDILN